MRSGSRTPDWQGAVLGPDGEPVGPLAPDEWVTPGTVAIDGDYFVPSYTDGARVRGRPGLLAEFAALVDADAEAIRLFASSWGMLGLRPPTGGDASTVLQLARWSTELGMTGAISFLWADDFPSTFEAFRARYPAGSHGDEQFLPPRHVHAPRRQTRGRGDLDGLLGDRTAATRRSLAISATKSMTGHMMGAAGAFEAFATVLSVAEQCVPPTLNYRDVDPDCDLWVVTDATPMPIRYALSNMSGLGGHNAALIVKRYAGE